MMVYATTFLAYSKDYVFAKTNMYKTCCYNIVLPEFSMFFSVFLWLVTIIVTLSSDVTDLWQHDCDITSNSNPKFKIEK